jgi:small subunit ribosomal protein S7
MSRRHSAEKRQTEPDPTYNDVTIAKFINKIMLGGKKSTARSIVYKALALLGNRSGVINTATVSIEDQPKVLEVLNKALDNAMPLLEVKTRRIGGANYQVPVEIPSGRRQAMAMVWLITYSRARNEKTMEERLANELLACSKMEGATIKKKEEVHRQAEANKAFAHFKF